MFNKFAGHFSCQVRAIEAICLTHYRKVLSDPWYYIDKISLRHYPSSISRNYKRMTWAYETKSLKYSGIISYYSDKSMRRQPLITSPQLRSTLLRDHSESFTNKRLSICDSITRDIWTMADRSFLIIGSTYPSTPDRLPNNQSSITLELRTNAYLISLTGFRRKNTTRLSENGKRSGKESDHLLFTDSEEMKSPC